VIIVITGVFDDIMQLKWWIKLVAPFVAAGVAVAHGIIIHILANPVEMGAGEGILLGVLCIPISILWIVGITNSVNLIDGLDGLACGVSTISSLTMFAVAIMLSENGVAFILAALVGACLGFLPYNFNPAKIFMGDTGALLLGYVLATASIIGMFKFYAIISFVVPLLALALPLFDTLFAILRRVLKGQNPMTPDRGHLHHRLIDRGLSQKQAVAVLYCLSAVLGLTAVVISTRGSLRWLLVIIDAVVAAGLGFYAIKQIEHPANRPRKREEEDEESEF
ncbi:MAG: undecaprenyl/decaprenyl-phosphate alpha-N-acetylglucosaminyl 1-phosphate transferase, partial [Oscillospiraceae bacterium]|nr:undecaprenyl/decaprenyl-phosphate alpha-N-acetylglucosaminyl 1-phosphate transferase [Oscillospiraceae bacterium]